MSTTASIVIVDDEPNNFDVIESMLVLEGYTLDFVSSGFELFEYLERQQPDVILLDVMMPKLNGLEVCRRLRANTVWQHIPVIMVTALNSRDDLANCLSAGADDFIGKPVNSTELQARVRSMIRIKHQYDELQTLLRIKDESLQLREDLSNMIVHDLRNPLSAVLMAIDVLKLLDLTERQYQKVEQIELAGQQLQTLIDDLLLMAKLESGKLSLNRTYTDPCMVAFMAIADLQVIADQRQIALQLQLPDMRYSLMLDVTLLRRILDNLVSNAIKFSPSGNEVTVTITYPAPDQLQIQVQDRGYGISEELQQRIFEKFETGNFLKGVKQTGLGLAFCKLAVEAHGGSISVESALPQGSIFTVNITG